MNGTGQKTDQAKDGVSARFLIELALLTTIMFGLFLGTWFTGDRTLRIIGFTVAFSLSMPGAFLVASLETRRSAKRRGRA